MKGQPVSSRFQYLTESRNGRDVIVTKSPHSSEHYRIYLVDNTGREIKSTFVYGQDAMKTAVNEYLGE